MRPPPGAGRARAVRAFTVAAATLGAALVSGAQAAGAPRIGVLVRPDTVHVGQPFTVAVRVDAPAGATIVFPPGPDSGSQLEALDPRAESSAPDAAPGRSDRTSTYRLVAWNVGALPIVLGDVIVRPADGGAPQRIAVAGARIVVASVLPADTAQRAPREGKWIFETPAPWWWPWVPLVLGALAVAAMLWWGWLRQARRRRAVADAAVDAERAFVRLEALGLLEAGERGRFVALTIEVLREYLARRLGDAALALTTGEVVAVVQRRDSAAPSAPRLDALLGAADLIKFARRPVATEQAREMAREARAIVREVEAGERAAAAAAAAVPRVRRVTASRPDRAA